MAIKKLEPFAELTNFRREMDRLWDSFWGREPRTFFAEKWAPAVDVFETADEIIVKAELPGLDIKDIFVYLSGENLLIKGEKKEEKESEEGKYHTRERRFGWYVRSMTLPARIDAENVTASLKKGLLEIRLPKAEGPEKKQIEIKVK